MTQPPDVLILGGTALASLAGLWWIYGDQRGEGHASRSSAPTPNGAAC